MGMVEVAWTLHRNCPRNQVDLGNVLRALCANATVTLESAPAVRMASDAFEAGPADFADCLFCAKAVAAGCDQVATFDRSMKGLPAVKLL